MGEKSILIIGSKHIAALELVYSSELTKIGVNNEIIAAQDLFLNFYNQRLCNKAVYRLGLSRIIHSIQTVVKVGIEKFKPDIVLVFKGMEITPKTLKWIKNQGICLVNYNPDNPFIFSSRGSGNKNVTQSIGMFDFYFTYDRNTHYNLTNMGIKSRIIPFGFDSSGFVYNELHECDELMKVCFLGNADNYRIDFVLGLAKRGVEIDVYGENWERHCRHKNIKCYGPKYGEDFWRIMQCYAVQLNLLRPHNINSHNMRSFDIPGAGGIMLAPRTTDHSLYFKEEIEVFLFSSMDEACSKINYILNCAFSMRQVIRCAARSKAISEHQYSHRVHQLLECVLSR